MCALSDEAVAVWRHGFMATRRGMVHKEGTSDYNKRKHIEARQIRGFKRFLERR